MDEPLIEPSVLDYVTDYIEEANETTDFDDAELDPESNLLAFYQALFSQFFANVLNEGIASIGPTSGRRVRELYLKESRGWDASVKALVRDYQHICKIYPDLVGAGYGSGGDAVTELHLGLLPRLMTHLRVWADEHGQTELSRATAAAGARYEEFLENVEVSSV